MEIVCYITIGFLVIRWSVALINWISTPKLYPGSVVEKPLVSILIPARDEALNLPHLFRELLALNYPRLEIIVLNDHSVDETQSILDEYCRKYENIQYLNGDELPNDWLGKHWACHQLAHAASGDYYLYLDADINRINPELLEYGLAFAENYQLALLSLFPNQIMQTEGEKIVVPLMHHLLLSLLPLWAIYYLPFSSMAAANGQFMLFRAKDYLKYQWHEQVKQNIVEDIAIMQNVKQSGLKGMTLLANGWIHCRMYSNFSSAVDGFSKNILAGFGNSISGFLLYLILVVLIWAILVFYLPLWVIFAAVTLILSMRVMISISSGQSVWGNLVRHPFQMLSLLWIGISAIHKRFTSSNEWKGRKLP